MNKRKQEEFVIDNEFVQETTDEVENATNDMSDEEYDIWLETALFQNGPTNREVEEWKEKFGSVFFTPFEEDFFIWRTLDRSEYREIIARKELSQLDREEIFVSKCMLFPRNITVDRMKSGKAGVPSLLAEMILDKSGFVAQSAPIRL